MQTEVINTLSAEYIYGLIADRKSKAAELAALDKKIDAALLFAPPGFDPTKPLAAKVTTVASAPVFPSHSEKSTKRAKNKPADDNPSWPNAILIILAGLGRGMSHKEIVAVARQRYEMPPQRNGEEKSFYNALIKLTASGKVIKHGNLLYAASVYQDAERDGALPPLTTSIHRAGSTPELVVRLLRAHPGGMTGPQMQDAFRNMPHAPKSLVEHRNYLYNVLAPMIGKGQVVRSEDGIYQLVGGAT